ncbi:MAG: PIN domain-containing protein, partial [Bacteroidota bacterium]
RATPNQVDKVTVVQMDKFRIKEKIKDVGIDNCFVSEITIAELTYGATKSTNYEKHIGEVVKMEQLFSIIPIYDSFQAYAIEKVRLQKQGILIPDFDLLIGTTSVKHGLVMVSNNEKHLSRIENIVIENWTKSEFNPFL